jgi:NAD(P)H-dependent flavin oxidoreductase YrpB (nitropropane dioxygenase family)
MQRRLRTALAERKKAFCDHYQLRHPILLAPMAGACPPALSIAVAGAGGLGACGALLLQPNDIRTWAAQFRAATSAPFQINLWTRTRRRCATGCTRRICARFGTVGTGGSRRRR